MSCINNMKNPAVRSVQTVYNNAIQPISSTAETQLNLLGNLICDTGCALDTETSGFRVLHNGIYRLSFDVTCNSTMAGINLVTIQMYNGETPLPCAISTEGVAQNAPTTLHAETILALSACRVLNPYITIRVSGVDGDVTHICASAVKIA